MKAELRISGLTLAALVLSAPIAAIAGGGQAFKDQQAHNAGTAAGHVRDWSAIDANGDHFISATEMEAYLLKQRAQQEAATQTEPQAGLNQAERLYARMMNTPVAGSTPAQQPTAKAPEHWNQIEKLYWALQPAENGGFLTAGTGKFQWQIDDASLAAMNLAAADRVLDSIEVGMHFRDQQAGKRQPSNRIYIPGATYTVEIPAGKHQTGAMPGNLVELKPAEDGRGS